MGSAPSSSSSSTSARRHPAEQDMFARRGSGIQAKIMMVGSLQACKKTREVYTREDLREFLESQKVESSILWSELQSASSSDRKRKITPKATACGIDIYAEDEVYEECPHCGQVALYESYCCRVCGTCYHRKCLISNTDYTPSGIERIEASYKELGWSCPQCDNLFTLLNPDEVETISAAFDQFDTNKDSKISLTEFITYKQNVIQKSEGRQLNPFELEFEMLRFRRFDEDDSGTIEYCEFMKSEAANYLADRPKDELVALLKPRELRSARRMFLLLDATKDGNISMGEAQIMYHGWYKSLGSAATSQADDAITRRRVEMLMEGDQDGNREIDWAEYIESQALYIISSRPNGANYKGAYRFAKH